jgi:hypothetical protein
MPDPSSQVDLIAQARSFFAEHLIKAAPNTLAVVLEAARALNDQPAERLIAQARSDQLQQLMQRGPRWTELLTERLRDLLSPSLSHSTRAGTLASSLQGEPALQLVDDETVQKEILTQRLGLAVMDRCTWEFADLRARAEHLLKGEDLAEHDLFRPQSLARAYVKTWVEAGLSVDAWSGMDAALQTDIAQHGLKAYEATNAWLIQRGVLPEIDMRSFIRRSDGSSTQVGALDEREPVRRANPAQPSRAGALQPEAQPDDAEEGAGSEQAPSAALQAVLPDLVRQPGQRPAERGAASARQGGSMASGTAGGGHRGPVEAGRPAGGASGSGGGIVSGGGGGFSGQAGPASGDGQSTGGGGMTGRGESGASGQGARQEAPTVMSAYRGSLDDETRMMTRQAPGVGRANLVLENFSRMMDRHLPGFKDTANHQPASGRLAEAMNRTQERLAAQVEAAAVGGGSGAGGGAAMASPSVMMREFRERQQVLKDAANTPAERATIELVALLFQSILTEDRIPAVLRVWFARLQMPVLRVAIAEPDFFSSLDHPTRRLIDRMGACVMGFEGGAEAIGPALEAEIKRVVQVVEAFPDTGRRVFQTVLNEFERFLEKYFSEHHEVAKAGVSLAQQIEQRETLSIQYTIELRKMLAEVPVQEGVRDFLFHIWADVLATTAVRHGPNSEDVKLVRNAAAELMWTASAKTSREERAEVIRRLPPLLATLRQGMTLAGQAVGKQEEAMKSLSFALTAAFGARATVITNAQLDELQQRLATIEEMLPDEDFEIDETWVLDESHPQSDQLQIVSDGGSMPTPATLVAAGQLGLGTAYRLDYRGRQDVVRLTWQGMRQQLSLFVTAKGRCVLFQRPRLAAFLQAGLLVPAQDESLTLAATRSAIQQINANPARLH